MADSSADHDLDPRYRIDGSCWKFIPVISDGFFNEKEGESIFKHQLILLQLQLALIFILATTIHLCLRHFYLPRLISEVLSGVILGPTILGRYLPDVSATLFSRHAVKVLSTLTRFGYLFFMFLIGVKMDVNLVRKSGRREWTIGSIVIIFPILFIVSAAQTISLKVDKVEEDAQQWVSLFAGLFMLTSFPVVAILLMHLKIINSELGNLTLSSALISDLISVVIVNLDKMDKLSKLASDRVALKSTFLVIVLIMFVVMILRGMIYWIIRRTPEGKPVKDAYLFFVIIALLVVAVAGENAGLQYMYGPFILGLTVPTGHPLASTLIEKLDTIVAGWMLPLMSTYCGFRSDLWVLKRRPPAWIVFTVTFGVLFKMACGFISAICLKVPLKDATAMALMLTSKGIIELGCFATNVDKTDIDPQEFSWAVLSVSFYAALVPIVTRKLYDPSKTYRGYQKRTVLNSSLNEGVRVLACAHRKDDALSAIKLLQLTNPFIGTPLSVFGLYLEELVGGSSPLLLNHQLGQKSCSEGGHWQPIIDVFNHFKNQCSKPTQVQVYTAISPQSLMHEDVCWVSFQNSVALIILPFHRKRNRKGKIIADSKELRAFNIRVMNKAPCSVGILVDRDRSRWLPMADKSSTYRVCVLYLGGKDDREALAIGRRMKGWPSVYLTVIRCKEDDAQQGWEAMLDEECLRDIKHQSRENNNVFYKEEIARHGADTSLIVGSLLDENYDLILVGRHSDSSSPLVEGLSAWVDLPELGAIGDMLASSEISKTVSVFVVQQQVLGN
ncbi:putative Cation proton exchanger [Hibiscus syriacus]|uniref:Cation proton exchanger n=1 Tax=Hibiscus syriacus TaxID=106335 RepID=A0A6A2ZFC7_HIBSY|nr:cation/H(+) antiporter 4-like [Hibiscus syriacus]KAE8689635.1 putative Cation proton exchanger [Hibiscus syriacus]